MKVKVHPQVYEEMEYYRAWYESKAKNLGTDYLREVDYAIKRVVESPETWPWYDKENQTRKFLIHRFPFGVIYRLKENTIQILAVADLRRKPGYWKNRLTLFSKS